MMTTVRVVTARPLIATFPVVASQHDSWATPSFSGVASLVEALSEVQSGEVVTPELLEAVEARTVAVAPVTAVNPRGVAATVECDLDGEDDLPTMDRFEVVFDSSWATDLAEASPSFRQLSERMVELTTRLAPVGRAELLQAYWRLVVSFPGAAAQRWYADDVDDEGIMICEVPLTVPLDSTAHATHTRFPLGDDGEPVDLEGKRASDFEASECVIYASNAVHYYTEVCEETPRVMLQLILSDRGDPNDGIPTDSDESEDGEEGEDGRNTFSPRSCVL